MPEVKREIAWVDLENGARAQTRMRVHKVKAHPSPSQREGHTGAGKRKKEEK